MRAEADAEVPEVVEVAVEVPAKYGPDNLPDHWRCTHLGDGEYQFIHDGSVDDGPVGSGAVFRTSDMTHLGELLKHRGRIPLGHELNPHVP